MTTPSAPVEPSVQPRGTPDHTVRLLLEPGQWAEHDPFLLLLVQ